MAFLLGLSLPRFSTERALSGNFGRSGGNSGHMPAIPGVSGQKGAVPGVFRIKRKRENAELFRESGQFLHSVCKREQGGGTEFRAGCILFRVGGTVFRAGRGREPAVISLRMALTGAAEFHSNVMVNRIEATQPTQLHENSTPLSNPRVLSRVPQHNGQPGSSSPGSVVVGFNWLRVFCQGGPLHHRG